jgi:hypothetical protein
VLKKIDDGKELYNVGVKSIFKADIGETVRISKYKSILTKGYEANFTRKCSKSLRSCAANEMFMNLRI